MEETSRGARTPGPQVLRSIDSQAARGAPAPYATAHAAGRPTVPLVSVIVPTFNRADCLANAVDSALAQTHTNLEVLVVDDGSTDGTAELMRGRWTDELRVRYFRRPNRGVSAARNVGLSRARGAFAAFLDSDDVWLPWKLEVQLACMAKFPDAVMVHSDLDAVDSRGRVSVSRCLRKVLPYHGARSLNEIYGAEYPVQALMQSVPEALRDATLHYGDAYPHLLQSNLMMPSAVMVRRNAAGEFERFDETLHLEEAYDYFLRVCHAGPVAYLEAATYRYECGRDDHLWKPGYPPGMAYRLSLSNLRVLEAAAVRSRANNRVPSQLLARPIAGAHAAVARSAILVGARKMAMAHFFRSVRLCPRQRRAWLLLAGTLFLPLGSLAELNDWLAQGDQRDSAQMPQELSPGVLTRN